MKTFDEAYESITKKKSGGTKKSQRTSNIDNAMISRMSEESKQPYIQKGNDLTAQTIYSKVRDEKSEESEMETDKELLSGSFVTKGAWEVKHWWSPAFIDGYYTDAVTMAQTAFRLGMRRTCEDLPLNLLILYAQKNGLPLTLKNGSGTYNQEEAESYEEYWSQVLSTSKARDIVPNAIQLGKGIPGMKMAKPGQMLLLDDNNDGIVTHAQVVETNSGNIVTILQGNLQSHDMSSDPTDGDDYGGMSIEHGTWDIKEGTYMNNSNPNATLDENAFAHLNPALYIWNFQQFTDNAKSIKGKKIIDSPIKLPKKRPYWDVPDQKPNYA